MRVWPKARPSTYRPGVDDRGDERDRRTAGQELHRGPTGARTATEGRRRGGGAFSPLYLIVSLALVVFLLVVFLVAGSRLP